MTDREPGEGLPPPSPRGGWYADPFGRYESRYHNGSTWTADVAAHGSRFVDPLGTSGAAGPTPGGRNGLAVAAMVLGIIGVAIGWLPFLFAGGVLASLLGLGFGAAGLRRSRRTGVGRSSSIIGLVTGACGLAAALIGAVLTVWIVDVLDEYEHPNRHEVALDTCRSEDGVVVAGGTITNLGADEADFVIRVDVLRRGTDNRQARSLAAVDAVPPGGTAAFRVSPDVELDDVSCEIVDVSGPLPFGIDIGP